MSKWWTRERDAELLELHHQGMQGVEIASVMSIHPMAVSRRLRVLREEGLLTPPPSPAPVARTVPDHIRRLNRARRGFDVPPHLEGRFIELIKTMSIADAGRQLKLTRDR